MRFLPIPDEEPDIDIDADEVHWPHKPHYLLRKMGDL